jgi:hypothetical protein
VQNQNQNELVTVFLDEHIGKPKCEQADWPGAAPRRRHKIEGTEMPSWAAGAGLELPSVVRWQRKGTAATETRPPETALTKETERRPALEHCAHMNCWRETDSSSRGHQGPEGRNAVRGLQQR